MRKVFLADAHLKKPEDFNYRTLLQFLSGLKGNTDTLYILGDLFEFWLGHNKFPFPHYRPVLEKLQELHQSGVTFVYFEGNHDFHMGPFFEKTIRAQVYRGPQVLSLDGKKVYFCHGDQVLSDDHGYKLLRLLTHNHLLKVILPFIPSRLPGYIAEHLGRHSKGNHTQRKRKWNYETILNNFATAKFKSGCDIVIAGHFHTPFLEVTGTGNQEKMLLSLGDWIHQFSYGEWLNGKLYLRTFTPQPPV